MATKTTLTRAYFAFAVFETISINIVGFTTLVFQDYLATLIHPGREPTFGEAQTYQYWLVHDPKAFNTEKEYVLALMVAGWIALAGVLQACINFDSRVNMQAKKYTLYAFFFCDWLWVALMVRFRSVIHLNHIVGSAFTIAIRLIFVLGGPSLCFVETKLKEEEKSKKQNLT